MNAYSTNTTSASAVKAAEVRVAKYGWKDLSEEVSGYGCAIIEKLLSPQEYRQIAGLYPEEGHFCSHVHMAHHGFGKGE